MMRLFAVLLVLQPPFMVDNRSESPSVWSGGCKGLKGCKLIEATDGGRTVFVIRDGDGPVGPCDLGKLVRATKAHLDTEHPEQPAFEGTISAIGIPAVGIIPCRMNATDAQCRVYEAEAAVKQAQADLEAEKMRAGALDALRSMVAVCSPEVAK